MTLRRQRASLTSCLSSTRSLLAEKTVDTTCEQSPLANTMNHAKTTPPDQSVSKSKLKIGAPCAGVKPLNTNQKLPLLSDPTRKASIFTHRVTRPGFSREEYRQPCYFKRTLR